MPRTLVRARPMALAALLLGAGLLPSGPAGAQVLIYEGPYGPPPRAYPAPPPAYAAPRGYGMLGPGEVRAIVRGMGYHNVSTPRLAGRLYVLTAVDEEGPAVLRIDSLTGRVVSARSIYGGPTIAVPTPPGPRYGAPPPAVARPVPRAQPSAPAVARATPPAAAVPLPPARPAEATVAAVTPEPAIAPAIPPAAATPQGAAPGGASATAPAGVQVAPAAPSQGAAALPETAKVDAAKVEPAGAEATKSASAQPAPQPARKKAGAGTATTDNAAAGTASVLSRPKAP